MAGYEARAVYTNNRDKIAKAREQFFVGNLYFNRKCTGAMVGAHPFGGFNMEGPCAKAVNANNRNNAVVRRTFFIDNWMQSRGFLSRNLW